MCKCSPILLSPRTFAALLKGSSVTGKDTGLDLERVWSTLYFPQEFLIDGDIDYGIEVKLGVPVKPGVIHTSKSADTAQGVVIPPPISTEADSVLQSPIVVSVNTPPPVSVLENSPVQAPEGGLEKEKTAIATVAPRPEPPIVTLTAADGSSIVDVDMEDGSQPDTKASSS